MAKYVQPNFIVDSSAAFLRSVTFDSSSLVYLRGKTYISNPSTAIGTPIALVIDSIGTDIAIKSKQLGTMAFEASSNYTPSYVFNASVNFIGSQIDNINSSLNLINNWEISQDASIQNLRAEVEVSIYASKVFYDPSSLDSALAMPSSVGGIAAGTTVSQLNMNTVTTILNNLLFPTVQPTLNAPSASITMSPATTLYEVSTNIPSLQFTTAFNQGSIYNGATYQNLRSGSCNNYDYTGTNLVDASSNTSPNVQSFAYNVAYGNQTWSCVVAYNQGPQPKDNKGANAIAGPLVPGSVSAGSQSIEGSYPYYASTVTIGVLTKQTLIALATNPAPNASPGFVLAIESGGNKQAFEIPNARLTLHALSGIRTYNTVSAQWEYQGGTNTASLTSWTTSIVTETIQGYVTPYTRYTYNGSDRAGVSIRLEF
jgi:hypothetical protein